MRSGTLILLHGWAQHAGVWDIVRDRFSGLGYRIYSPDLPGHGQSEIPFPPRLHELRDWMEQLLSRHEQVFLLGWSLGGVIATYMMTQFPAKVSGLITVGTLPNMKDAMPESARQSFRMLLHQDAFRAVQRLTALMALGDCCSKDIRSYFRKSFQNRSPAAVSTLCNGYDMLMNADLESSMHQIKKPCLLLSGERDYFIPEEAWQACQKRMPAVHFQRIRDTGHAPFVSRPEDFVRRVEQFIRDTQ